MTSASTARKRKPGTMTRAVSPVAGPEAARRAERRLEGAGRGGADRDDAAALRPRAVDRGGRVLGDGEALGVDAVLAHVVDLDRPEGPGPDVQDELGALDRRARGAARGAPA